MNKVYHYGGALLMAGLLTMATTLAKAAEATTKWTSGLYATASVGRTQIDNRMLDVLESNGLPLDDTDTGYSLGLGYDFNKYLAVEAGYMDVGEASIAYTNGGDSLNGSVEGDGFYFGPKVSLPLTDKLAVFGKIGFFTWDGDVAAVGTGAWAAYTGTASEDGTDLYFGGGVACDITETLAAKAEWTRYTFDGSNWFDTDVDFISAGLTFKFGKLL